MLVYGNAGMRDTNHFFRNQRSRSVHSVVKSLTSFSDIPSNHIILNGRRYS